MTRYIRNIAIVCGVVTLVTVLAACVGGSEVVKDVLVIEEVPVEKEVIKEVPVEVVVERTQVYGALSVGDGAQGAAGSPGGTGPPGPPGEAGPPDPPGEEEVIEVIKEVPVEKQVVKEAGAEHFNVIGGSATVNDAPYDVTFFKHYGVNPFIDTEDDHLSTFAMDVDTASYTVARRFVQDGNLPNPDSVRVEEFVNFFDQGYEPPAEDVFAIHIEGSPSPFGGDNHWLMRVGL